MGKSTTQKTKENSNQQTFSPQYVQEAGQNLVNSGTGMTGPFLQTPNYLVGGFSPDQIAGFDIARDIARQRQDNTYKWYQGARDYDGGNSYTPFSAASASGAMVDGSRINDLIGGFMSPFQSAVIDSTTKRLGQDRDAAAARIGAQSAAASPFGGSGEALQRAQLDRNHGDTLASTVANLQNQGFGQALGQAVNIASQEASNRQAAGLANAGFQQQAGMTNAQQGAAFRDAYLNRGMQGLQMGSALETQDLQRQLLGLQTLLSSGDAQQAQLDKILQAPWGALSTLAGITPQDRTGQVVTQGEKETTTPGQSPLQTLLGAGLALGGMGTGGGSTLLGGFLKGFGK